jgi:cell division protein FtsN
MRIDYSEPKKSYVSPQGGNRPRKDPVGTVATVIIITGVITFIAGFGTGWLLSQRSAKKSFQAAMEQTSLESLPRQPTPPPKTAPVPPAPVAAPQQPQQPGTATEVQTMPEPPLSFFKTLPNGQKSNVIGSGINSKDDKGKQPLQAAIPSNLNKQSQAQTGAGTPRPAGDKAVNTSEKVAKSDAGGFSIQVASYSLKSEAETMRGKLAGRGYNVFVVESNQGDKGIWYRVRIGRRLEQDAAKELAGKLGKGAIVIPDKD